MFSDILDLIKIRILMASLLAAFLGYVVTDYFIHMFLLDSFFWVCIGISFIFSGSAALNHYLEVGVDSKMERTKNRPLPTDRVSKHTVLMGSLMAVFLGTLILIFKSNVMVVFISLLIFILYVFIYTPLKQVTWLNTFVGAFPGALPLLCGWYATEVHLSFFVLLLFGVYYFWQLPHFFAIAWINKSSYEAAQLKMVSLHDHHGLKTSRWLFFSGIVFIVFTYLPVFFGFLQLTYGLGISVLNISLIVVMVQFWTERSVSIARKILFVTILYPPSLLAFVMLDLFVM